MFDKIFYINLAHRTDRDKNVKEQIKKLYPDSQRMNNILEKIDGVYGNKLDIPNLSSDLITKEGKNDAMNNLSAVYIPLTKGAIGCALSHRKAYQKIIDDNLNSALILEDDIAIDPQFMNKITQILQNCPNDYDVLFLGYHRWSILYLQKNINNLISQSSAVFGLFGYIVSNKGARKLMNIFPITKQIDSEMSSYFREPEIKTISDFIDYKTYGKYLNLIPKKENNNFTINAYIVNPNHRLIFSDESNTSTRFGTDIQIRELFNGVYRQNEFSKNESSCITSYNSHDTLINIICMLLIASIVYLIVISI
ncbi:MAG: glycosyltransferase family 25 [Terrestrivirus sp.]|uniref:Glycosyltransferase family 25 n=1 Tax=Terrestrivirus sp. TaxID=2487775 RepID=A0A3G4ZL14_9VIRU|nr:MAG: glycosyltransferase family 25 [Terrestrivirus sp.]